jgi:DNA-directed RNA polymerase subunit RPC12/RpoP
MWFLVLGIAPVLAVAMWAVRRLFAVIDRLQHQRMQDVMGDGAAMLIQLAVMFAIGLGGLLVGVAGRRRAVERGKLQAALAAKPPSRPGGPARCRRCDAPLEVKPSDLGVRCLYCRSDNLVAMPEPWVKRLRGGTEEIAREIEVAAAAWLKEEARKRRDLRWQLVFVAVAAALVLGIGAFAVGKSEEGWPPSWRAANAQAVVYYKTSGGATSVDQERLPAKGACVERKVAWKPKQCVEGGCTLALYAALKHGEGLKISSSEAGATVRWRPREQGSWWYDDQWGDSAEKRSLARAETFGAPSSGWYRADAFVAGAKAGGEWPVCVEIVAYSGDGGR